MLLVIHTSRVGDAALSAPMASPPPPLGKPSGVDGPTEFATNVQLLMMACVLWPARRPPPASAALFPTNVHSLKHSIWPGRTFRTARPPPTWTARFPRNSHPAIRGALPSVLNMPPPLPRVVTLRSKT